MPSQARSAGTALLVGAVVAAASVVAAPAVGVGDGPAPVRLTDRVVPAAGASVADAPVDDLAGSVIPGRLIVRWKAGATSAARTAARAEAGARPVRTLGRGGFELVRTSGDAAGALRELRSDPRVASVEPDRYLAPLAVPNDPDLPLQWALRNTGALVPGSLGATRGADINVLPAWDRTVGSPGTTVAVIDGGYDFLNPDLGTVAWTNTDEVPGNDLDDDGNGKVDDVHGWDFVGASLDAPVEDADPTDDDVAGGGHGMHVAGIVGARGGDGHGVTGVAQDVRIMPLRVCTWSEQNRREVCSASAVVDAINYAGRNGARVANLSLGGPEYSQAMVDAFAANPGTLYVVAAGNASDDTDRYAAYPCKVDPSKDSKVAGRTDNLVCVAASDQQDKPATFTNYGARTVDLAAPGVGIYSLFRTGTVWREDFEKDDFDSRWVSTGSGFGRGLAGDGKLVTAGLSDSPESAPQPGPNHVETTLIGPVPTSAESCRVTGQRFARIGEGSVYEYSIKVEGERVPALVFEPSPSTSSGMQAFLTTWFDGALIAGRNISFAVDYDAAAGLDETHGVWMDNLKIVCARTQAQPALYEYLSGTSMASPMVAGAAALLFSLKPSATPLQVKAALVRGARPLPAWKGKVASGGRLDVAAAMGALVPPETRFDGTPVVKGDRIYAVAAQNGSLPGITFQCAIDKRYLGACSRTPSVGGLHPGRHLFRVRAVDQWGNADPTPSGYSFVVTGCKVPRLIGNAPARVRPALTRSGCAVGKVRRPPGVPFRKLRVKATYPRAGVYSPTRTAVTVVLVRKR